MSRLHLSQPHQPLQQAFTYASHAASPAAAHPALSSADEGDSRTARLALSDVPGKKEALKALPPLKTDEVMVKELLLDSAVVDIAPGACEMPV